MKNNWRQILSWKIQSDEFYNFEKYLQDKNISYYLEGDTFIIDHRDYVSLPSLKYLPSNVVFNNQGYVYLYSLKSLPDNIQFNNQGDVSLPSLKYLPSNVVFNNQGDVSLPSLKYLPDNIQFNNQGDVYLYSLKSLPSNVVFNNKGIVNYNYYNNIFDSEIKEKLSWQEHPNITDKERIYKLLKELEEKGYTGITSSSNYSSKGRRINK